MNMLNYEQYCVWVKDNIDTFDLLYEQWAKSGFDRRLTPSIDRIDNSEGYIASNMRWVTLSENSSKGSKKLI